MYSQYRMYTLVNVFSQPYTIIIFLKSYLKSVFNYDDILKVNTVNYKHSSLNEPKILSKHNTSFKLYF